MRKTVFCLVFVMALVMLFAGFLSAQTRVKTEWNWAYVSDGRGHSAAIRTDGTLWAWGYNNRYGQLGDGTTSPRTAPVRIGTATNWASVSVGRDHSVAIRRDGTLWAWGNNRHGQLGDGTGGNWNSPDRLSPVQVGIATNWASISAGSRHTVAMRTDGTLWTWGLNEFGQLGDGTGGRDSRNNAVGNRNTPVRIGTLWASASAGGYHTVAISADGTLWAWGANWHGELGDGTRMNRNRPVQVGADANWLYVSAGGNEWGGHTMVIRMDGSLWAWGNNQQGQLGDGTTTVRDFPVQVGTATNWASVSTGNCGSFGHTVGTRTNGSLWIWGGRDQRYGIIPMRVGTGTNWAHVSAGNGRTAVIKTDGTLWIVWGQGFGWPSPHPPSFTRIGTPANWASVSASAGGSSTATVGRDGTLWARGGHHHSDLIQAGEETNWTYVSAGQNRTIAIRTDGTLWTLHWGLDGSPPHPVRIGTDTNWASVSEGRYHTVAIRTDGTLWTFNWDWRGAPTSPVQIGTATNWAFVSAGETHTVAIRTDGTLWAWGRKATVGNWHNTHNYGTDPVQIGTAINWASVSAGGGHTVAIKTDGTLWAWGYNNQGQLGTIWGECCCDNRQSYTPIQIGTDTNWVTVSAGGTHTVAIRTDGTLWAWGNNGQGQLGDGTTIVRRTPVRIGAKANWAAVSAGWDHNVAISKDGNLWAWGARYGGTLVLVMQ